MKKQTKPAVLFCFLILLMTIEVNAQWSLTGNTGTNSTTNFIGTIDAKNFKIRTKNIIRMNITSDGKIGIGNFSPVFKLDVKGGSINTDSVYRIGGNTVLSVKGSANSFIGISTGFFNTTGAWNTAAGYSALYLNSTGTFNTAIGAFALLNNIDGSENVANGASSLRYNNSGDQNTASGDGTLYLNTTGSYNTATGYAAMFSNSTASYNTANGYQTLYYNTTGEKNSTNGAIALQDNTTGYFNTASGYAALKSNTTGFNNTANGVSALYLNTTGSHNTAIGMYALYNNTNSSYNTAIGYQALYNNVTGQFNTAIGYNTGANNGFNPSNGTALGYGAGHVDNATNEIEIGNTSVGWIAGQVGWSSWSDKRIKDNIQSNVPGLAFITKLNPVTYNLNIHRQNEMCGINDANEWEGKYDIEKITQTGFLAQEVEQAAKENNFDFNGVRAPKGNTKLYSLQYAAFVVPLVKAVQELNEEDLRSKTQDAKQNEEISILKSEIEYLKSILSVEQQHKLEYLSDGKSNPERDSEGLLFQNSPNPFTEKTTISYSVPASSQNAEIKIFSEDGKEIKAFRISNRGYGQIEISGNTLLSGIYNYTLLIDGNIIGNKQMILTK